MGKAAARGTRGIVQHHSTGTKCALAGEPSAGPWRSSPSARPQRVGCGGIEHGLVVTWCVRGQVRLSATVLLVAFAPAPG